MKRVLVSWSTGKDSAWMVHTLRQQDGIELGALLTTVNARFNRVAMHGVRAEVLRAQADALRLPLWPVPIPHPCSNEAYEREMTQVVGRAVAEGFTHVAFGDLFLEDIRRYREARLAGTGLTPLFPLFGADTAALARDMIDGGLKAIVTCVDPTVLPASFAGREFDDAFVKALPPGVDPCGERGEFHTIAYHGPMFARPVAVARGEVVQRYGYVFADVRCRPEPPGRAMQTPR